MRRETVIYLILTVAAMMTGFLDDCAKVSWGELRKGLLDLVIAIMTAITYVNFNGSDITIALTGQTFTLNPVVYGILAVILVWGSINVTNCADGVDGQSGTLASITLATVYLIMQQEEIAPDFAYLILLFIACILGYLWYNATELSDDGRCGLPCNWIIYCHCSDEDGKPFLISAGCMCSYGRWWYWSGKGVITSVFAY